MIVGKIRVENFRGMSLGLYDENNRLHATAVTERVDLQAICDGYNAFLALSAEFPPEPEPRVGLLHLDEATTTHPESEQPRRGRGRPRKEATE